MMNQNNNKSNIKGGGGGGFNGQDLNANIITKTSYESPAYSLYFYGRLLREESERILKNHGCHDGLFLLRELVQEAGSYALSICFNDEVHHYKIERQDDGNVKIEKGRNFIGPIELIKHHQQEQDGLVTRPTVPCNRPKGTSPIYYLFVNDSEFYKLVDDEIKKQLEKLRNQQSNLKQYAHELNEARGRYRYKYERIVLKDLHNMQPWFKSNCDRVKANELLTKSGVVNGKFIVRSSNSHNTTNKTTLNDFFKISLCFNKEIKHYKVKYNETVSGMGKFSLYGGLEFESMIQLVDYYHRCSDGLPDILRIPLLPIPNRVNSIISNYDLLRNKLNQTTQHIVDIRMSSYLLNAKSDDIYDSNRMYETILNTHSHVQQELTMSFQPDYIDDEPQNSNDIFDLTNVPESKRTLFEEEDNYSYDFLSAYTVDAKDLVVYDKLGSGCFGSVHRGIYKTKNKKGKLEEIPVAIKQLNIDTVESKQEIVKEAETMKSLKNSHVIRFIGMCFDQISGQLMIVLELAKLGPLHKYLRAHKEDMSIIKIVKLCYQVALAMEYIASKNLVHRDLAARNVLLASEDLAKVSDFGMSRKMNENLYYSTQTTGKWPLKWYPPEALSSGKFNEKSDVWSFGVTCWEATSYGGRPYQGIDVSLLILKLENGHRLEKPQLCPQEIFNIMYKCWHAKCSQRPKFSQLVDEFKTVIKELYNLDV